MRRSVGRRVRPDECSYLRSSRSFSTLTRFGIIDFIPEGDDDLSWESISSKARPDTLYEVPVRRVSLEHLLVLKRLAGRPRDREDMVRLQEFYGLPPQGATADDADANEP